MKCRLCLSGSVDLHIDFGKQPIIHELLDSPTQPYATYPFKLGYCERCGFMQIIDHIPPEVLYKNYFTVSGWKSQPHVPRFIQVMESVFNLTPQSRILEIGCNDGVFLEQLGKSGYGNTLGIEPTEDSYKLAVGRGLNVVHGFFNREYAAKLAAFDSPDIVVSRQVIEHIPDLHEFLTGIYDAMKPDGGLVLELPDSSVNYEALDYALWEQHVNYFTFHTLSMLLSMCGFEIIHHESTLFSGKCMFVFAQKKLKGASAPIIKNIDHAGAMRYKDLHPQFRQSMREFIDKNSKGGVAVYGAGNRSCNFINLLGLGDQIDLFVDDQPEKQNKHVPGCDRSIRSYDEAQDKGKFFLLGVNAESENKVINRRKLTSYASVQPPSRNLPEFWRVLSGPLT